MGKPPLSFEKLKLSYLRNSYAIDLYYEIDPLRSFMHRWFG